MAQALQFSRKLAMGNSFHLLKIVQSLNVSNARTQALLEMLVLCGTARANSDAEKNLIVFLAGRDQSRCGDGLAGFEINAMPWEILEFEAQRRFIADVVDDALARTDWSKLDYEPSPEVFAPVLKTFKEMVEKLECCEIAPNRDWTPPDAYVVCERHSMLKFPGHLYGKNEYICIRCDQ